MATGGRPNRTTASAGAVPSDARVHQGKSSRAAPAQRLPRKMGMTLSTASGLVLVLAAICLPGLVWGADSQCAQSPRQVIKVCVSLQAGQGRAVFDVSRLGHPVLAPSNLGLEFAGAPQARYTAIASVVFFFFVFFFF